MDNKIKNEYFYVDQSAPRNVFRLIIDLILGLVTLALAVALIMAYMSRNISPESVWYLSFFGLTAPFLYLGNFVMLLFWVIRWRWWALIPLVTLICGVGSLGSLVQIRFKKQYIEQVATTDELKVATYNVHGFSRNQTDHNGYLATLDSVAAYFNRENPSVICFQEYETMMPSDVERIDSLFHKWPYRAYNFIYGGASDIGYGTAIFSSMPILKSERLIFKGSSNSMIYVDMLVNTDTIRVFNNHLQSTQIDDLSQNRVEQLKLQNDSTENFVKAVGSRLKNNYIRRATQVDTVSQIIRNTEYPVIVTGDFNDTPISYSYKKMRGDLVDTFVEQGSGLAYTYNRLFSMLRIDYIFHSPTFETIYYHSEYLPWSDHNPVIVRIVKTPL